MLQAYLGFWLFNPDHQCHYVKTGIGEVSKLHNALCATNKTINNRKLNIEPTIILLSLTILIKLN